VTTPAASEQPWPIAHPRSDASTTPPAASEQPWPIAHPRSDASTTPPERLASVLSQVPDPEIPVLTIRDLGILRDVRVTDGRVHVTVTPTYSGCPAMDTIRRDIVDACAQAGWPEVTVHTVLAPAWTTDWLTEEGKRKLREYGIAPPGSRDLETDTPRHAARAPQDRGERRGPVLVQLSVRCPQCGSPDTRELSRFGSTACKALYACNACLEPFDHFKAI